METESGMERTMRQAFKGSGLSMKRLNDLAGTQYASTYNFFAGDARNPALQTVQRWCDVLGLELTATKRRGQRKGR